MKQIGLALHNCHDSFTVFPIGSELGYPNQSWACNWRVGVLSYMEESALAGQINTKTGCFWAHSNFTGNEILFTARVKGFVCPSSRFAITNPTDMTLSQYPWNPPTDQSRFSMVVDYVGISGATPDPAGRTNVCTGNVCNAGSDNCHNGMLVPDASKSVSQCTDGTSNVIIVAEQSGQVNGKEVSANPLGAWHGWANVNRTQFNSGTPLPLSSGGGWYTAGTTTVRYLPNAFWFSGAPSAAVGTAGYTANTVINSYHPGGLNILMTDGSVRFLSEAVPIDTLRRLCVRDDDQAVANY